MSRARPAGCNGPHECAACSGWIQQRGLTNLLERATCHLYQVAHASSRVESSHAGRGDTHDGAMRSPSGKGAHLRVNQRVSVAASALPGTHSSIGMMLPASVPVPAMNARPSLISTDMSPRECSPAPRPIAASAEWRGRSERRRSTPAAAIGAAEPSNRVCGLPAPVEGTRAASKHKPWIASVTRMRPSGCACERGGGDRMRPRSRRHARSGRVRHRLEKAASVAAVNTAWGAPCRRG